MPTTSTSQRSFGLTALGVAVLVAGGAVAYVATAPAVGARIAGAGGEEPAAPAELALAPAAAQDPPPAPPVPAIAAFAPAPAEAPPTEAERAAGERLSARMSRLVRDLEFTPGLREPPQQTVREAPEPWHPDPLASEEERPVIKDVAPRGAPAAGGTRVTIRGENLRVTQVMFGRLAARIVDIAPEAITVLAPRASPGPVSIVLTNDDGTYAIAAEPFVFD